MSENATVESVLSGEHRWCVIEGDNAELLHSLPAKSFDVIITDPPYDEVTNKYAKTVSSWSDNKTVGITQFPPLEDPAALAKALVRLSKRWAIAFCAMEQLAAYRDGCGRSQWVRSGVWDKVVPGPQVSGDRPGNACEGIAIMHPAGKKRWNRGGGAGIWRFMPAHGEERFGHPTPKPIQLMNALVTDFSDLDEVIFDPFGGSGTTGAAALSLGRRVVLVEQNPEFAATCRTRLAAVSSFSDPHRVSKGQRSLFG